MIGLIDAILPLLCLPRMNDSSAILDLHISGLPLPDDLLRSIHESGIIEALPESKKKPDNELIGDTGPFYDGRRHLWLYKTPDPTEDNPDVVNDPNYYSRIPESWVERWNNIKITKKLYTPRGCPDDIPKEMNEFIMSSWNRFDEIKAYEPFYLYCEQARRWREEATNAEDYVENSPEWVAYIQREFARGRVNILYILDKYASIKDDSTGGRRKYFASTPQALLLWLKNVGCSYILMKGRQAAITSTEMAASAVETVVTRSFKGVLITDDVEETGKNIFEDKYWSTLRNMPDWFVPKKVAHNSSLRVMFESGGGSRAERKRDTVEFGVLSGRDPQAVNGMGPTVLQIDEGQNVAMLERILQERSPTQIALVDGKMRVVRRSHGWGTAASSSKGAGAIEEAFKHYQNMMIGGKNTDGWVVLFFDAFCRPGMSYEAYLKQYYKTVGEEEADAKGKSLEDKKSMFASHYPMSVDDTFRRTGGDTVVPWMFVKNNRDRIAKGRPLIKWGHFVPEYDESRPMPDGMDEPFYVRSVRFEELPPNDPKAGIRMFKDRETGWTNNYCQFTDPIQSYTGNSKMASAIMAAAATTYEKDGQLYRVPAPVCVYNHRNPNVKENWKQTKYMGMYYANHGERACPELVEYDQGQSYIDWVQLPFLDLQESLVPRAILPIGYDSGQHPFGVGMKEGAKTNLHRDMSEFNSNYAQNVWFSEYFVQLSNIEQVEKRNPSGTTKVQWGSTNTRKHNDDLVIAIVGSFVVMKVLYGGKTPKRYGTKDEPEEEKVMLPVKDASGNLSGWREVPVSLMNKHYEEVETR